MSVAPFAAARHLCALSDWTVSNLRLQKILYIADMNFVGWGRGRLINELFEAWDYGPVLPSVYHQCKAYGARPVQDVFWGASRIDDTSEAEMLALVWERLRQKTPGQLVAITHSPLGAWTKNYVPGARGRIISDEDMVEEYRRRKPAGTTRAV